MHELSKKKLCGEDLARTIGKRKGSKLTPGTIYPALKSLRQKKLIEFEQDGREKVYFLTKGGKRELTLAYRDFGKLFSGFRRKVRS